MADLAPEVHRIVSLVSAQAQKPRPQDEERQLQQLARLRQAGRFSETLAPLHQIVRHNPKNPRAHNDLGLTYRLCSRLPEAIASFGRAIALDPDYANAYYNLGIALEQQGREAAAIAAYRRAVAAAPKFADAHGRLGVLLIAQGHPAEAVECFRRAAAASSNPVGERLNRGKALLFEEKFDDAELWLRRAVAVSPGHAEAHRVLGLLLYQTGRFDEAVWRFEQAAALDPNEASVYYYLTIAKKITESDRPHVRRMLFRLERADIGHRNRIGLHFALGKAFDDLAEYEQAIRHFDEANRLLRLDLVFDRARFSAENDQLIARFTPELFAARAGLGAEDETPILILGMPRSGTTLVEQIVSAHPMVGAGDELNFWHETAPALLQAGSDGPASSLVARAAVDYCALLRRIAPGAHRVTDKMPANFRLIGPIHLALPRARIIHCRRHPVDTCLSSYFTQFTKAQSHACSREDLVCYYREYSRLMAHWRTILPADRLFEIDYEELIADRERTTRRLIEFCGLDWDEACLRPEQNARIIKTASVWQARQPVHSTSVERWRLYEPWLGELRELLPPSAVT